MPVVAMFKLEAARILGSGALRAEAKETLACTYLSFTLLLGLSANALFGWWWADPVAAFLMVPWLIHEGKKLGKVKSAGTVATESLKRQADLLVSPISTRRRLDAERGRIGRAVDVTLLETRTLVRALLQSLVEDDAGSNAVVDVAAANTIGMVRVPDARGLGRAVRIRGAARLDAEATRHAEHTFETVRALSQLVALGSDPEGIGTIATTRQDDDREDLERAH